jgi:predicted TIM-barrel fold metal-dependent hydrolase
MSEPVEIVDSHHHLMDFSEASYAWLKPGGMHRYGPNDPIARNYLPEDYRRDTAGYRVIADVHVEGHRDHHHHPVDETRWLARLNQGTGCPTVCVGAADLEAGDIAEVLAGHAAFPFARGIRSTPKQMIGGVMMGNATIDDERWRRGYAMLERHNFVCDLLVQYPDMDKAAQLARDFPRTTLILNHMAYPPADLNPREMAVWRKSLEAVAPLPNVVMKVSGMCLGGTPWRSEFHLQPIRDVLGIFGADRCMFGSNFPVDRLAGSFDTIVSGMRTAVSNLPEGAQRQFFRDTAARVYRIPLEA